MSIDRLPTELVIEIVGTWLPWLASPDEYLALRLLNRHFNHVILFALFDLRVCDYFMDNYACTFTTTEGFIFRHWRAVLQTHRYSQDGGKLGDSIRYRQTFHSSDDEQPNHQIRVRQVICSAIAQIVGRLEFDKQSMPIANLSTVVRPDGELTLADQCIYVLCMASIQLHGKHLAWRLLTENIELPYLANRYRSALYVSSHEEMTWQLYAAVYINDLEEVKRIIDMIKIYPGPRNDWRHRLSLEWNEFVRVSPWETSFPCANATLSEQKWIKAASSALVIAGCMGHVDIIEYLMRIEPYLSRNGPRTQLWTTSLRSAMGQAVVHEQREAFKVFLKHRWPLLTSTGFPRMNWWNGLRIALETTQDRLDGNSIFEFMLDMSSDWKCQSMVDSMLQAAASRNNIQLARVVLDRLHTTPRLLTYSYVFTSKPKLPGRSRDRALGTAAWLGRVELVDLLLRTGHGMSYADPEARECAIHAIICHLRPDEVTANHLTILNNLLQFTDDLILEQVLVKAAYKHDVELVSTIARNVDLKRPYSVAWLQHLTLDGECLSSTDYPVTWAQELYITWGEVMLATALKRLKFNTARCLISDHNVSLRRCFVKESAFEYQFTEEDAASLKDCIDASNMLMMFDEGEGLTYFEFWPESQPDVEPFEFWMGRNAYRSV